MLFRMFVEDVRNLIANTKNCKWNLSASVYLVYNYYLAVLIFFVADIYEVFPECRPSNMLILNKYGSMDNMYLIRKENIVNLFCPIFSLVHKIRVG